MSKKRRTREQKIIAKLKRQLRLKQELENKIQPSNKKDLTSNNLTEDKTTLKTQEIPKTGKTNVHQINNQKELLFSYDPKLIKKSLIKTSFLSIIFFGAIFLLYYLIEIKNILPL